MKVELTYFKPNGKLYTQGEYETTKEHVFQIFEEVGVMWHQGQLPGLMPGHSQFIVYVNPVGHEHGYPHLIGVDQ